MTKLLLCVDASPYAEIICAAAARASECLNASSIDLLHVVPHHSDYQVKCDDHTGTIGFDSRNGLMEELAGVDEARGKLDQKKGRLILEHCEKLLKKFGVEKINLLHLRGDLSETIKEIQNDYIMIFIGKRGEHDNINSEFLGSNLEKTARLIHKPLFVVSRFTRPIKSFLITYDGKENAKKAVDFAASSPFLQDHECHLLTMDPSEQIDINSAIKRLTEAGFEVKFTNNKSDKLVDAISSYIEENNIDLILTGAYSHSYVRTMFLGSTTASLIKICKIPMLLFR